LRAQAGGLLRGCPTACRRRPPRAGPVRDNQRRGHGQHSSGSSSSSASGTIITATGSSIPNYDPSLSVTYAGFHQTSPQPNTVTTGTTSVAANGTFASFGYSQGFATGTALSLTWNNER